MKIKLSKKLTIIFGVILLAFLLRGIVSSNLDMNADELVYSIRGINFLSTGRLSLMEQAPTYYYVQALLYELFGVSVFITRLPNIIFGSFTVILIFLIGKEYFGNKKAYIASFLFAISGYSILRNVEMDMMAIFLMLFSMYFYIKGLKYNEKYFIHSSIFLGVGLMTKSLVLLFVPIFIIHYFIWQRKIRINIDIKKILYSIGIIIIIVLPILSYNLFLYEEKGIVDIRFSQYLGMHQDQYQHLSAAEKSWEFERFTAISKSIFKRFFKEDFIIFIFGTLGIGLSYYKKKKLTSLFLLSILIPIVFLSGITSSASHYIVVIPFICLFASLSINFIAEKMKKKLNFKHTLAVILIIISILNMIQIMESSKDPFSRASIVELRNFAKEIPDNSLVITDSRIYRGNVAYAFHDKHYLEGNYFNQMMEQINNIPSESIPIDTYFIECESDDCGWGKSKISPELHQFSESLVDHFKTKSIKIKNIKDGKNNYTLYKTTLTIKPEALSFADSTHYFFQYPVGWWTNEGVFDTYKVKGFINSLINIIAYISLWLGIGVALLSIFYLIHLLNRN